MNACTKLCQTVKTSTLPVGGTYTVLFWLPRACLMTIGRLGHYAFRHGYYTYTGSAKHHLAARLHRHLHGATTRHWHLDYFRPAARVLAWQAYPDTSQPECHLAQRLLVYGHVVVPKFGASDCSCTSHLVYYSGPRRPPWRVAAAPWAVSWP